MGLTDVVRFESPEALARSTAGRLLEFLSGKSASSLCLSGGRITVALFHELLAQCLTHPPGAIELVGNTHFFWADERCVPAGDTESNFGIAERKLFEPLNIDPEKIHQIPGEADPVFAAQMAEAELCRIAPINSDGIPIIDLLLLGMGEDGHVASLFPGQRVENQWAGAIYYPVTGPKPPPNRITLSFPTIQAAKEVWVLVSGNGKEESFRQAIASNPEIPLGKVIRDRDRTLIFTDLAV
ncbi:MAG: pgl2 [Verrucomicrobiales bacterium]|nr:pgl2 [Verrucomicrobiales bacterium]